MSMLLPMALIAVVYSSGISAEAISACPAVILPAVSASVRIVEMTALDPAICPPFIAGMSTPESTTPFPSSVSPAAISSSVSSTGVVMTVPSDCTEIR